MKSNTGFTMVEVVVSVTIILTAVTTLLGVHSLYIKTASSNTNIIKATFLAEESIEALRFLRDSSWTTNILPLSLGTSYGMIFSTSTNTWQTSSTNKYINNFQRTVTLSAVYRDANGDIVSSGGVLDANVKLITSSVAWPERGATTTKSISTYLTNIHGN